MAASVDEKRHSNTPGDASSLADEKQQPLGDSQAPTESGSVMQEANDVVPAKGEESVQEKKSEEPEYVTGIKLFLMVGSVTLACFLMLLDISIIVTAIPRITTQFHSLNDVGWYGSAYTLACSALQPLTGKFYTYFKTKWTFLTFLGLFELGSLLCGVSNSSMMLIISRAVAGLGGSGIMNGGLSIIAMAAPLEKRPSLMGIVIGCAQLGIVAGPLIGGALTEYTTWRWCFYINLPIGAVAAVLILFTPIPDRRLKVEGSLVKVLAHKLDLLGFTLFAPAAVMILLAVQWGGNTYAWDSGHIIGLLCGGAALAVIFAFWEKKMGDDAMIPLPIIRKRQIWTACLTMLFLFCTVMTMSFYMPIYFQSIKGATPFTSGVDMLPGILVQVFFGVLGGFLIQKVGYYLPFGIASGMINAVGWGLLTTLSVNSSTATWAGYQALIGFGRACAMQVPIIAIQANSTPAQTPVATSILVFSQNFGGAIIIAVANAVFTNKLTSELKSRVPVDLAITVVNAGARGARSVTPAQYLPAVLTSYAKAVDAVFYVGVAGSCLMFITAWGMGWQDIRKKKVVAAPSEA